MLKFTQFISEAVKMKPLPFRKKTKAEISRRKSTEEIKDKIVKERQKRLEMAGLRTPMMGVIASYIDIGHDDDRGGTKEDNAVFDAVREKVWGVRKSGRLSELWVYSPSLKPSKGMKYVNIQPLTQETLGLTHEDIYPEYHDIGNLMQGRIDHERKTISVIALRPHTPFSSTTIDRVLAELKRAYTGYKILDMLGEGKIQGFKGFFIEANRGLSKDKHKWLDLGSDDIRKNKEVQSDIFNIVSSSYKPVGGHPDFPDADSVPTDNDTTAVIDTDSPEDIDAAILSKKTPFGRKLTALASDGGQGAKKTVVNKAAKMLRQDGNYVEASGKALDILQSKGAKVVDDEDTVKKVLRGKEISWKGDGSYSRKIGGTEHTKKLLGNPKV